ncbi:MAG TPA: hypothetical protein VFS47_00500, partial [Steroidobacteraceae bacterium]|nr:hypothetical protein [Steroidobacteraceae bacterium]
MEFHAAGFQRFFQECRCSTIQLTFHQRVEDVHDGDVHALLHQPICSFETQEAAADDNGFAMIARGVEHYIDVLQVSEGDDARKVSARYRKNHRIRSRCEQKTVIRNLQPTLRTDNAFDAVDGHDGIRRVQRDSLVPIPLDRIEDDLLDALFAG